MGVNLYDRGEYVAASSKFIQISGMKFNDYTTAAIYMAGKSYFEAGDPEAARTKFQFLLSAYSQSMYVPEARYHLALLNLSTPGQTEAALDQLAGLAEKAADPGLKADAADALKDFLYNKASAELLRDYLPRVPGFARDWVLEALALRAYETRQTDELKRVLNQWKASHGNVLSSRLARLETQAGATPTQLRLTVLMPFMGKSPDSTLTLPARIAAEFYQGLSVALQATDRPINIEVKAFDTNKSQTETQALLANLGRFNPQVIVGELFNGQSRLLSQYAEKNNALCVIPFSPANELLIAKKNTFLLNASYQTQAQVLARYVYAKTNARKVFILNDYTPLSRDLSAYFAEAAKKRGLSVVEVPAFEGELLDATAAKKYMRQLAESAAGCLYIPSNNEKFVAMVLTALAEQNAGFQVLGTNEWLNFQNLSPATLAGFQTLFPETMRLEPNAPGYVAFVEAYQKLTHQLPSVYAVQGYDLGRMLTLQAPTATTLHRLIRADQPYVGLGQTFSFPNTAQDNQAVRIYQFRENGAVPVE
jgi:ABC-type branched-subunit amino acid transport system substrate-binding protein